MLSYVQEYAGVIRLGGRLAKKYIPLLGRHHETLRERSKFTGGGLAQLGGQRFWCTLPFVTLAKMVP